MYKMFCDLCGIEMPDGRTTHAFVQRAYQPKSGQSRFINIEVTARAYNADARTGGFDIDVCAACLVTLANDNKNLHHV